MKQFAIRDQRYTVLYSYSANAWQMFDLESDPWETTKVYDNPQYAKGRAALLGELASMKMKASTNGCFVDIPAQ
jgi:arylsulfatase A-like enzyme